jgi:hypothetical protein
MSDNIKIELKDSFGSKERHDSTVPMEIQVPQNTADHEVFVRTDGATEKRNAAALLLSVAEIASKEIRVCGFVWDDDEEPTLVRPKAIFPKMISKWDRSKLTPRFAVDYDSDRFDDMEDLELPPTNDLFAWSRARAVSMDSEGFRASPDSHRKSTSNIVSPESSPISRCLKVPRKRGLRPIKHKRNYSVDTSDSSHAEKRALPNVKHGGRAMKKILRKKFSWKNYPELEAFLIANREEYLRHSALNYTVQQKQYNNRLTERLIELAAEHGYVFDDEDFSFVTVRDRIRCYFKSYVQSAKKRGVIIGYAARKAGLLTEEDLEKSAGIAGRIVLPTSL